MNSFKAVNIVYTLISETFVDRGTYTCKFWPKKYTAIEKFLLSDTNSPPV